MVDLLKSGKRILNIDETWLNTMGFQRRKWKQHGTTNSVRTLPVTPRISLILGFDSSGDVYLALTQVNTDHKVMQLYLSQLAEALDIERPTWRDDTVVLLDGARYHTCQSTRDHIKHLRMPVMFSGPRSYDTAPCELFFASLKNGDLNPLRRATGKK